MSNGETKDKTDNESLRYEKFVSLDSKQVTCKLCGLTARNETELEDHVRHAHKNENNNVPGKSS
ncbi:MAG: hypothetical protein DLM72_08455 [Candidatus Nitrosopolaris wilkensis]|nr:MAG: hypothetical protein DLM72_08455 [Candidatus Nitrosopolaris wilkensis]